MKFNEYIQSKGFTINALADAAGVSPRSLERYSYGDRPLKNARAWFIVAIADALGTTPKFLLSLDE